MVTAQEMGAKGGKAKSKAKTEAARKNASRPRGKWVTFAHYQVLGADNKAHTGCFWERGRLDLDLQRNGTMLMDFITEELIENGPAASLPWKDLRQFGGVQVKVV